MPASPALYEESVVLPSVAPFFFIVRVLPTASK
jgi:hypothetical protein